MRIASHATSSKLWNPPVPYLCYLYYLIHSIYEPVRGHGITGWQLVTSWLLSDSWVTHSLPAGHGLPYFMIRAIPTARATRTIIIIVQIVIGVRLLALASLRSDALLRLRLLFMVVTVTRFLPESIAYRHLPGAAFQIYFFLSRDSNAWRNTSGTSARLGLFAW